MRRRKFLLASGSAVLGGSTLLFQNPTVALDFTISGVPKVNPSDVNTIAIEFETFNLKSNYIDDSQDADVTISLTVGDRDPATETTKVSLVNGQSTDVDDIREATPVVKQEINTTDDIIIGEVIVSVNHPDVSDSFKQTFSIASSDTAVQSIVAESDLVGWWTLNEYNGDALDYSGNNNDGSLNGGVTQGVAGRQGITAYSFDGGNDYVDVSSSDILGTSPYSISCWFKYDSSGTLIETNTGSGSQISKIAVGEGSVIFDHWNGDGRNSATVEVSNGEWYHVLGYWTGSENVIVLNGGEKVSSVSENSSPYRTANDVYIGTNDVPDNKGNYFEGIIQDVRIYNRALSQSKANVIYNKGTDDFTNQSLHDGTDSNSVARYALDGNSNDKWGTNTGSQNGVSFIPNAIRAQAGGFQSSNNDLIDAGDFADGLNDYTVSAWINPDSLIGITNIVKKDGGGIRNERHFSLRIEDSNGRVSVFSRDKDGNSLKTVSDRTVSANNWAFIAGKVKDDTAEVYVNGVQKKSDSNPSYTRHPASSEPVQIGGDNVGGFLYYDGLIDDVRIYNRALSNSEIRQLYLYGTRGKDLRPYLENINT